ncbi:MAG: hypothetical protein JSS83_08510 [Cyanobacteria bacterium SZAS LIN-3]|nr:hypothetical protein [Cyanobacteria bacterium SZAS LIN-3]
MSVRTSPGIAFIFLSAPVCHAAPSSGVSAARTGPAGNWRACLSRANVLLKKAATEANPQSTALLAVKECRDSLAQQKSPLGCEMLAIAWLMAGSAHNKEALQASRDAVDANSGGSDSQDLVALAAFLGGDLTSSREALVHYTGDEVRISHPESHTIIAGALTQRGPQELAAILRANPLPGDRRGQARALLLKGLIDFFNKRYNAVIPLHRHFNERFARQNFPAENDFALNLTACAELLTMRADKARVAAVELLSRQPVDPSTPMLVDTAYFALSRREEGLRLVQEREATNSRVCKLGRAWVLDEMSQPKEALDVLNALALALPGDAEVTLQQARMEAELNLNKPALDRLNRFLAGHPKSGQAYILRAQIYVQKKEWPRALADLNRAVDLGYGLVKAVRARSACYAALGHNVQAQNDMNLAESFMQWVH